MDDAATAAPGSAPATRSLKLLTAAVFVSFALRLGVTAQLPAFLYFGAVGVALAVIDLDTRRLPDVLVLPSYPVGLAALGIAALATGAYGQLGRASIGMAVLFAFYFLLAFIYPAGMGFGDVKLAGVVGLYLAWLGWGSLFVGAFTGFLLGGVAGIALLLTGRAGRKTAIPYGPFMLAGAFVAVLVGQHLSSAYTGLSLG